MAKQPVGKLKIPAGRTRADVRKQRMKKNRNIIDAANRCIFPSLIAKATYIMSRRAGMSHGGALRFSGSREKK